MNIITLTHLFSSLLNEEIYAINFPEYTKGQFIKFEITSSIKELGGVMDFNVQFMTKAQHPADAEKMALNILNKLDMLTNIEFAENRYQLILARAETTQPFFVGETTSGDFLFSVDFRLLITKI